MILAHQTVARDFGKDRRCGDRDGKPVSLNNWPLWHAKRWQGDRIHKQEVRWDRQGPHGSTHGLPSGLENIENLDFPLGGQTNPRGDGLLDDRMIQAFPNHFGHLFRVIETRQDEAAWQNHDGRHNRTRERTSAGLVQPSNKLIATPPGFYFKEVGRLHNT